MVDCEDKMEKRGPGNERGMGPRLKGRKPCCENNNVGWERRRME